MKSKRIEILDNRPVNKDGFIDEWPEMGFVAMKSPYDPKPSIRIENGKIMELDGKERKDFDFLDQFIADYAIRIDRTVHGNFFRGYCAKDRGYQCFKKRSTGTGIRYHSGKDVGGHQSVKCGGNDDGYAENARPESAGKSGAYHQSKG